MIQRLNHFRIALAGAVTLCIGRVEAQPTGPMLLVGRNVPDTVSVYDADDDGTLG